MANAITILRPAPGNLVRSMRQSIYIAISLLMILCITGCADKDRQGTLAQEDFTAAAAVQGMTENAPKPSGESSEKPENPFTPHSGDLLSEEEKVQLQNTALSGKAGLVSVTEDTNMQNPEKVEEFYTDYLNGQDSMVTVFDVHRGGLIGAVTFIYRNGQLQACYIGVRWKEDGAPEIRDISMNNVVEIKLTEKGYFIYAYDTVTAHSSIRQYWRISPLSLSDSIGESVRFRKNAGN